MSAAYPLPHLLTVADFLGWEAPDASGRWELIDGSPQAMAPSRARHGLIAAEAARLLGNHLVDDPRCRAVAEAGVQPDAYNLRIPDLTITCEAVDPDALLLQAPMVIVEILSPSNRRETWAAVIRYMAIASVREILVLHSDAVAADLLCRGPGTPWPKQTLLEGDELVLESIGFSAPLAAFYRTAR